VQNPSPNWNTVPVFATWLNLDGSPKTGSIKFTVAERVYANTDDIIFPGGDSVSVDLVKGSIAVDFPAVDDPDISPNDWSVKVEEKFPDNSGATYYIQPKLSDLPTGVNLNQIFV
jgi:hypothetical protein